DDASSDSAVPGRIVQMGRSRCHKPSNAEWLMSSLLRMLVPTRESHRGDCDKVWRYHHRRLRCSHCPGPLDHHPKQSHAQSDYEPAQPDADCRSRWRFGWRLRAAILAKSVWKVSGPALIEVHQPEKFQLEKSMRVPYRSVDVRRLTAGQLGHTACLED